MKRNLNRVMRPFCAKLWLEAAIRAAGQSGVCVLPIWLVLALIKCVLDLRWVWLERGMLLAWALLFGMLLMLRYRPTKKRIAKRLDALLGMDRMATAVEFADQDGVLYRLQREDAVSRLSQIETKKLRLAIPKKRVFASLLLAAMIAMIPLIPQQIVQDVQAGLFQAVPSLERQESEEVIALRAVITALRDEVEAAGLKDADAEALLARLDEMLDRLDDGYADIAALQEIYAAMDSMQQTVKELTPRDTYMAAMIEYESLRLLGEAIFDQNMEVVKMILESMGRQLHEKEGMEQMNALMDLVYDINGSLAKPLRDNSQDQLRQGMMMFAGGLENAAEMAYNRRDNTKMIDTALDTVQTYIRDYLGVPEEGERYDPFADRVYDQPSSAGNGAAKGTAPKVEKVLSPSEREYVYNPPKALKSSSYVPGALDEQGAPQRIKAEERERPTGAVPYGEVFGAYYADYLSQLSDEGFPQELREAAQNYMNGL